MSDTGTGQELFVGVDLGGTKILAGVFDANLRLLGTAKKSTKPGRGPEAVTGRIARCVLEALDECDRDRADLGGVGIGAPGAVDTGKGVVVFAPNLDWRDYALGPALHQELAVPVYLENDCHIATLGVYAGELDPPPRSLAGLFLGTGIGGGLMLDGHLVTGLNGSAGELGHMVLQADGPECSCGNRGCLEALAGRRALVREIKAGIKAGRKTLLTDKLGEELKDLRSGDLRKAINKGDELACEIVERAALYTGLAVGNLINCFNPEVVVLGGGLIEQLSERLLPIIDRTARRQALKGTDQGIRILASQLGDHAGITGGASLALHQGRV